MPSDYFAPAFKIAVDGAGLAADISKNVTNVSVISAADGMDSFSITLANAHPELRWTHTDDADLFKEGNGISIELGYVDNLQLLIDGEITGISPSFPEGGAPTVAVSGYNRMHRLRGSAKTRSFQDVTDKEIAETVARDASLTPEAESTGTSHPYVVQCARTDFDFLRERAQRIRFEVLVHGKTLIFRKAQEDQAASYTLVWGQPRESFAAGAAVMPLRSFDPSMSTLGQCSSVSVRGYDPTSRKAIVGRAGSGDEQVSMGGSQSGGEIAAAAFGQANEAVNVDRPVASQQEADDLARTIYNDRLSQLVTGTGATIGLPDLRAGKVIKLEGLGPRFSGQYYVTQATHTIGGGGYSTRFQVRKGAV